MKRKLIKINKSILRSYNNKITLIIYSKIYKKVLNRKMKGKKLIQIIKTMLKKKLLLIQILIKN